MAAEVAAASQAVPTEHLPSEAAHVLQGHEGAVLNVRFNTQGTYCLSCGKVSFTTQVCVCQCCVQATACWGNFQHGDSFVP